MQGAETDLSPPQEQLENMVNQPKYTAQLRQSYLGLQATSLAAVFFGRRGIALGGTLRQTDA